jgi:hypothetical protein
MHNQNGMHAKNTPCGVFSAYWLDAKNAPQLAAGMNWRPFKSVRPAGAHLPAKTPWWFSANAPMLASGIDGKPVFTASWRASWSLSSQRERQALQLL